MNILIIGAGMSGAKAAHDLKQAGHFVTVLEARDRIGGRIWTNREFGYPMDIGASWIHGIRRNPVHKLAKSLNTELLTWDYEDIKYYSDNQLSFWRAYSKFSREFGKACQRLYRENPRASAQDAVDIVRKSGKFDKISPGEFSLIVKWEFEQSFATDAKHLALATFFEGEEEFSGKDVMFPNGYDALVTYLLDGVDVRLGQQVKSASYSSKGVVVETGTETFHADRVIVTVSAGVLKSGAIEFSPPLPEQKLTAISGLRMALLNKLCLKFDSIFWEDALQLASQPDARATWPFWFNITALTGAPTLVCMNSGSVAREVEQLTDEETVSAGLASLQKMYGSRVPDPVDYLVTRWSQDPYALGSYSHWPTGGNMSLNSALAMPVADRLYFAGEATETSNYATVHGAFLSGERAAAEIIASI